VTTTSGQAEHLAGSVVLDAEKLVGGGRAIAHHDGQTWMVAGALPGERVRVETIRKRAGIVEAKTLSVESGVHSARLAPMCPQAGTCGGCDWPHVEPEAGAHLKAAAASEAARAYPGLAELVAHAPIRTSADGYRLRARLHWDPDRKRLGFYEHHSRKVADITSCRILSPRCMNALPRLASALSERCRAAVDLEWLEGSNPTDTVVALRPAKGGPKVVDPEWIPGHESLGSSLSGCHALSVNGRLRYGWGSPEVTIDLPIPLSVPIGAFFQGNRHLILSLFERVAELVGAGPTPVFDLHAGVGYLAAAASFAGERPLTLVEPNRAAALAARRNLPGAEVLVASTAEDFVSRAPRLERDAIVMTDPPRRGLSRELRRDLARWSPRRVLMLGCDPATWARDAGFFQSNGYAARTVELFDLFPSTHHVEILALLERA
jgi:tRNA/tmRNA/rRNA uracil-C5-methylase (TrmA/RlmC/RlmD family)